MTSNDTYQGWTNRETWALMLHINNDPGLYMTFRDIVAADPDDQYGLEERIADEVDSLLNPSTYADTYGTTQSEGLAQMAYEVGSLWRVNWSEVVASLTED